MYICVSLCQFSSHNLPGVVTTICPTVAWLQSSVHWCLMGSLSICKK